MKAYRILIDKPARKFIERQEREQQERLLKVIYRLPADGDIRPLEGRQNVFRLRVGVFRVIYCVDNAARIVTVMTIGNRGDVYK